MTDIAREVFQQNKPTENAEFQNKEVTGEGVANIIQCGYIEKKDGTETIILKVSVTHPVDREKEGDNIQYGDEIAKFYNPADEKKMQKLNNDLFTAGIPVNVESDEAFRTSLLEAVNTFIYIKCWVSEFEGDSGDMVRYQNLHILPKSKVTPELIEPKVDF